MLSASPKDDKYIYGPSKRLLRSVRRGLRQVGIVPVNPIWRQTWEWAKKIADSYYSTSWPQSTEIMAQYVVLLLAATKRENGRGFKLPYRAGKQITAAVAAALPKSAAIGLIAADDAIHADLVNDDEATPAVKGPAPLTIEVQAVPVHRLPLFADQD